MIDIDKISFLSIEKLLRWKQKYIGLLVGMGKGSISRLITGERSETYQHKETLALIIFLDQNNLIGEYVKWRFGFNVKKYFYKYGTPMESQKYLDQNSIKKRGHLSGS